MREGQSTPWGRAQIVSEPAPGVFVVSTAGHGGIKLPAAVNRLVPEPLRTADGWYEEDCEAYVAACVVPGLRRSITFAQALDGVRRWFPEHAHLLDPAERSADE